MPAKSKVARHVQEVTKRSFTSAVRWYVVSKSSHSLKTSIHLKRLGRLCGGSLKPLAAPLRSHATFAVLWVSMSVLANYAFAYKISVAIFTLLLSALYSFYSEFTVS